MNGEFEKNDEWMMKATRSQREKKISSRELDAFHESVMKTIAAQEMKTSGLPYFAMAVTASVCLMVILGVIFYLHLPVPQKQEEPVYAEVKHVMTAPKKVLVPESQSAVSIPLQAPAVQASAKPVFKDKDIIEEIEALKEVGAWNEDDEEEAGIPVEVTYSDLEVGMNSTQASMPASVVS